MHNHPARFVSAASDPARLPVLAFPEVAFVGRSNVGKSSLLNRLVGQRSLARVSKTPGRTQQINFFLVDESVTFVDLPGYGFARVPAAIRAAWKGLVEGYLSSRGAQLCAVCVLIDVRRGVADDDRMLLDYLHSLELRSFVALTKSDKLARGPRLLRCREIAASLPSRTVIATSAAAGDGMDGIWAEIESATASGQATKGGARRTSSDNR